MCANSYSTEVMHSYLTWLTETSLRYQFQFINTSLAQLLHIAINIADLTDSQSQGTGLLEQKQYYILNSHGFHLLATFR